MSKRKGAAVNSSIVLASIRVKTILDTAFEELQMTEQWLRARNPEWASSYVQHINRAEALIELVEVFDCGSVGGFGKGQPQQRQNLFERWLWLRDKYVAAKHRPGMAELTRIKRFFQQEDE